jgi:hypothetical protein
MQGSDGITQLLSIGCFMFEKEAQRGTQPRLIIGE